MLFLYQNESAFKQIYLESMFSLLWSLSSINNVNLLKVFSKSAQYGVFYIAIWEEEGNSEYSCSQGPLLALCPGVIHMQETKPGLAPVQKQAFISYATFFWSLHSFFWQKLNEYWFGWLVVDLLAIGSAQGLLLVLFKVDSFWAWVNSE